LRSLILEKVHQIRKIGFDQVQLPVEVDSHTKVESIAVLYEHPSKPTLEVLILPCTDENGCEAVKVVMRPKEVKDGQNRVFFSNN